MTNKLTQFTTYNSLLTKSAFTLAETLIVMGIIGVVAALTLPNLNSSTGDKEKVVKLKKIYSNLNDAMGRAIAVYGPYSDWSSNAEKTGGRLTEFMKLSKDCGTNSTQTCFVKKFKAVSSGDHLDMDNHTGNYYTFTTADGTSVLFLAKDNNSDSIIVDIDGLNKGTNEASKDIFKFDVNTETGEITPHGSTDFSDSLLTCGCLNNKYLECTAWAIEHENLDYLKCADKLTANKTSCK